MALLANFILDVPAEFPPAALPVELRTLAAGCIAGLLVLALAMGHRIRTRALRHRLERLEQIINEQAEALAESRVAKTELAANISQVLRNPLNGILGVTVALESTPLEASQSALVTSLREGTTQVSWLVEDILEFATLEAGRIDLQIAPFSPTQLLDAVVAAFAPHAATARTTLTAKVGAEVPPLIEGDAVRIRQILVQRVSQALYDTAGQLQISAKVRPDAPGQVEFAVTYIQDEADSGHRVATSDARQREPWKLPRVGSGLGLDSCRLLANAMRGAVGIEWDGQNGARFFLRIPLNAAAGSAGALDRQLFPATSVLLVEDLDYNALAAAAVLREMGLGCERARNGEEAIALFGAKRHALVLLDRNLPDLDGLEVARRLRALESDNVRSLLFAVTAYDTPGDRERCLEAGMDAFVGKPLTSEKLRRAMQSATAPLLPSAPVSAVTPALDARLDLGLLVYLADDRDGGVGAQAERYATRLNNALEDVKAKVNQDPDGLGDAAHRLLGKARMISATHLAEACYRLESAARNRQFDLVVRILPEVEAEVRAVTAAVRRHGRMRRR